jgi:hypothetical protein
MKLIAKKGRTSLLVKVFLQDSSSTTGAGLTGLTSGSSGLVLYRARDDDGNAGATQVTLSAGTKGTWSSGGFVEKDATNMPGLYELGLPDAGQATGSETVVYMLKGATNLAPLLLELQLVAFDPQDAVALGLSRVDAAISSRMATFTLPANFSALGISGGGHVSNVDTLTTYTGNTPQTGDAFALVGTAGAGLTALGDTRIANLDAAVSSRATAASILTTTLTESYAGLHAAPTLAQVFFEIRGHFCEKSIAGTTLTTRKLDGSTTAETFTLNSATAPTSITRAT